MYRLVNCIFLVFVLSLLCSCGNSAKNEIVNSESISKQKSENSFPDLKFKEDFFDFGSIVQGEVVSHTFHFYNGGNDVLIVKDLIPDCGCTKTNIDKKVLKPNEEGTIEVIYDSRGWRGSQYKLVTIRTNSPIRDKSVTIKANVVAPQE